MGKRGPQSTAPGGYGSINRKGYRRVWDTKQERLRMEHVVIWERAHGHIKDGQQIHHKDGDKLNNSLDNLIAVDTVTHKRLHSGCELRNGEWWKPCKVCGEYKPVSVEHWYLSREGWPQYGRCRP